MTVKTERSDGEMTESEAIDLLIGQLTFNELNREAKQMAIKALEKQIAKKPIFDNYHRAGYRCPNCNNTNPWGYEHCRYCGQKLDWSERID